MEDIINPQENHYQQRHGSHRKGKLFVVGIGPGGVRDRTRRAEEAINQSATIVGYKRYLDLIQDLTSGKQLISSGMKQEVERCRAAIKQASAGVVVSLISSGDPGVYGMAGLAIELAAEMAPDLAVEIVPGVTAANAAAASLGAPLMLDYAVISLSDLLVPWENIRERLKLVAAADLVTALYNPRSLRRTHQLEEAVALFLAHRPGTTPVGVATAVGTTEEILEITTLERLLSCDINMRSIVLIGNTTSKTLGPWLLTPRGYRV
jgi:precorrin-3B C17-methyltransferase